MEERIRPVSAGWWLLRQQQSRVQPWMLIVGCAACGSVPFSWLIGRLLGKDIRAHGSKNAGATNLGRVCGWKWFFAGFVLDMLKGAVPVALAGRELGVLGSSEPALWAQGWWIACTLAGVLGHVFTPWLGFKGGKGVATALGVLLAMWPVMTIAGLVSLGVFLVVFAAKRYISLASLWAGSVLPMAVAGVLWWRRGGGEGFERVVERGWPMLGCALLLAVLVYWTHRGNIARLRAGTEPRAFVRKPPPGAGVV
jgi:glycerol-3-phosphate acyltransferase PlsY